MKKLLIVLPALICAFVLWAPKAQSSDQGVSMGVNTSLAISANPANLSFSKVMVGGNPAYGTTGIVISVTSNSTNGYSLAIYDNTAGTDSSFSKVIQVEQPVTKTSKSKSTKKAPTTTTTTQMVNQTIYLPDFDGTVTEPKLWEKDKSKGVGFTLYQADTNKETKWGNGKSNSDSLNKYAGIPQRATVFHSSPGFKSGADKTSIGFIVGIGQNQNLGTYSGRILLTAIAVLN